LENIFYPVPFELGNLIAVLWNVLRNTRGQGVKQMKKLIAILTVVLFANQASTSVNQVYRS
tara:strand:+ start:275 stop:457 length:183 start_codon:yes stop_codon:yes gene_type:complete